MRNIIQYFYNIEIDNIEEKDGYYIVDNYLLKELKNKIDIELYNYLLVNNIYVDKLKLNINNSFITNIHNKEYVLMEITNRKEITLDDIITYDVNVNTKIDREWNELWNNKVDYYEHNIVNIKDKELLKIYPYYIGLSEIASRIYKLAGNNRTIGISHVRLTNDIEFYNITNIILDYKVRDIAEYIKCEFFKGNIVKDSFIYEIGLSPDDYILLYSRLLYPSYFFDSIEKEENISKYTSKIIEYENYLNYIYNKLIKYVSIPKIDWLIKKM